MISVRATVLNRCSQFFTSSSLEIHTSTLIAAELCRTSARGSRAYFTAPRRMDLAAMSMNVTRDEALNKCVHDLVWPLKSCDTSLKIPTKSPEQNITN